MAEEIYDDEMYGEEGGLQHFSDQQDLIQRTPWWIISIIFHAAFLLMSAMWIVSEVKPDKDLTIFEMDVEKFKKPEYDPTLKRDIKKSNKELEDEVIIEDPVITKEDLPIDEIETPDEVGGTSGCSLCHIDADEALLE